MLIGTDYKIESDTLNITLFKRKQAKKTGNDYWDAIAFFAVLTNALEYLVDLEVAQTGLTDLQTVIKKQAELYALIKTLQCP